MWVRQVTKNFVYDVPPPQGLYEARRGKAVSIFGVTNTPRGRPFGGGGVHHFRGYGSISPHLDNLPNTCVTHSI